MKNYITPELELYLVNASDVITDSNNGQPDTPIVDGHVDDLNIGHA